MPSATTSQGHCGERRTGFDPAMEHPPPPPGVVGVNGVNVHLDPIALEQMLAACDKVVWMPE